MLTALIIVILTALLGKYFYGKLHYWQNQDVTTPNLLQMFKNTINALTKSHSEAYDFDEIYRKYKTTDRFVGIYQFFTPSMLVIDPELIKDVLITNFKHFRDNGFGDFINKETDPIAGRNPFVLKGDEWKEKRNEIIPAFSAARIKAMYPLINNSCCQMTRWLKKTLKPGESVDAKEVAAKYTTDVVSSCIFANDSGVFTQEKSEIREMGAKLLNISPIVMIQIVLFLIFPFLSKITKARFFSRDITEYFAGLMKSAVEYRETSGVRQNDYLEYLIELKKKKGLSEIELAAHGTTFFIDGFETSSLAIGHTLLEVSRSERIQTKLRDQIEEIASKYGGNLNYDAINEITYLDQCFNEALRLYPPGVMTQRSCNEEIDFETNNGQKVTVKEKTIVSIPIWPLHHDSDYYNDPNEFIPERFDPETGGVKAFIDKGVFLPFGNGPRACLGQRFANAQSKACIAEIVRNFELKMSDKVQYPLVINPKHFVNVPIGGIWIDFKPLQ